MSDTTAFLSDPNWFLDTIDLQKGRAVFLKVSRDQIEATPFLDERLPRHGFEARTVPIASLVPVTATSQRAAPAFIWHSAFCGSTLLARLLSKAGTSLCLREPSVLTVIASLKRHDHTANFEALSPAVFFALANVGAPSEKNIIKPTNVVNTLILDAAKYFPDAKHLFLTSTPAAFMVSIAKKKEEGRAFVRRLFSMFAKDGATLGQIPQDQLFGLTDLQIASLVWHMEIEEMRKAQMALDPTKTGWMDGDKFLASPTVGLSAAAAFFDLGFTDDDVAKIVDGPLMARDSKNEGRSFSPQQRVDEASEVMSQLGGDLERIIDWSFEVSPSTPRENYLNNNLMSD